MLGRSHRFLGITSTFLEGEYVLLNDTTRRPEWGRPKNAWHILYLYKSEKRLDRAHGQFEKVPLNMYTSKQEMGKRLNLAQISTPHCPIQWMHS